MNLGVIFLSETWRNMVSRHLGIDVDIAILEANDFLVKQIGILMKFFEKNNVRLKLNGEERRQLAELGAKLSPKKRDKYSSWSQVRRF